MRYVALWVLVAAAYAAVFAALAELPVWAAAVDGAVFGAIAGLEGLILWNVLRYGTAGPSGANFFRIGRLLLIVATGILFVAVAVGAETVAIWLLAEAPVEMENSPWPPAPLWAFPQTIPARCLITAAVYACFALWYSSVTRSEAGGNAHGDISYAEQPEMKPVEKPAAGEAPELLERISVRGSGGKIVIIGTNEIIYIQAEGDYVAIVTADGRWLKEGTMKWFEEALPRDRFVRVHRSYIVSIGHISRIETSGRDHTLILRNGGPVRISDTGYRVLKRTLGL